MSTLADLVNALAITRGKEGTKESVVEMMRDCTKYVVRPEVDLIAREILQTQDRSLIPWPLPPLENTWMEFSHVHRGIMIRYGLLLQPSGVGVLVFTADDRTWKVVAVTHDLEVQEVTMILDREDSDVRSHLGWFLDRMLIVLHMIQQPRILDCTPVVHDERLQKSRAKSRKLPLFEYRNVTVHVTRRERQAQAAAEEHERRTGRRLHHVRAFYRVKMGKIERVCAHWRGDAGLGVVVATGHRVSR